MKRFLLKGTFDHYIVDAKENDDTVVVSVPFLSESGKWLYGIDHEISCMRSFNIFPSEEGYDIISIATLVYLADTRISRSIHAQDSWTREIDLVIPVWCKSKWESCRDILMRMLRFLTGDIWKIEFNQRSKPYAENTLIKSEEYDAISLFSGGMDSLISTINELEKKHNILLVSHAGDSLTKNAQNNLDLAFSEIYSEVRHDRIGLWMVFNQDYIPLGGNENSTRSRSFLFISSAIFAATGTTNLKKVMIPENGNIALNVPLDSLRVGAHSTRTTHPFYLNLWNQMLDVIGLDLEIVNPYWNKTKGEMASECLNKDVLNNLMRISMSCSAPGKVRWKGLTPQHCGYCVPCIIRRAAMFRAFGGDVTEYSSPNLKKLIADRESSEGIQIRSFQYAIDRVKNNPEIAKMLIHKPGPLAKDAFYLDELAGTYVRGLLEVNSFIEHELKEEF